MQEEEVLLACRLILFGGRNQEGRRLNDVWSLDTEAFAWGRVPTMGAVPPARHSAASAFHNGKLIIFGGSGTNTRLNDVWSLDVGVDTPAWKQVATGGAGLGLRHSAGHCLHGEHALALPPEGVLLVIAAWPAGVGCVRSKSLAAAAILAVIRATKSKPRCPTPPRPQPHIPPSCHALLGQSQRAASQCAAQQTWPCARRGPPALHISTAALASHPHAHSALQNTNALMSAIEQATRCMCTAASPTLCWGTCLPWT